MLSAARTTRRICFWPFRVPNPSRFSRKMWIFSFVALSCLIVRTTRSCLAYPDPAQLQASPFSTTAVSIILPPKLMAAHPATLAVFGFDGKLAPAISVALSDGESVVTDRTGRAHFTAPATAMFLLAQAEGTTASALIDPASGASEQKSVSIPPFVSLRESFWLCGPGLQGDATADTVAVNSHPALVLAASPECLASIAPAGTAPGPASIAVSAPGVHWTARTIFVSLEFDAPHPMLKPGQKGGLIVRAHGSAAKMNLIVENTSPDVLRFVRGDVQQVRTSGGADNFAAVEVQANRSGKFTFRARIVPPPDPLIAARFLQAATTYATRGQRRQIQKIAARLSRRPRKVQSERRALARILAQSIPGEFRTLLAAAYSSL
jgi:hypothetical protein